MIKRGIFCLILNICTVSLFSAPEAIVFDFGGVMTKFSSDGNTINDAGFNSEMFSLVEELREHQILVGLLSNVSLDQAMLLDACGYYEPFDPCLLSCEIGMRKPDRRIYEYLLEELRLPAENVVFIDDRLDNVWVAQQVGIDAILFKSASQIRNELFTRGFTFLDQ